MKLKYGDKSFFFSFEWVRYLMTEPDLKLEKNAEEMRQRGLTSIADGGGKRVREVESGRMREKERSV